jgi:uncharacterized protein (TIGR02246 family)
MDTSSPHRTGSRRRLLSLLCVALGGLLLGACTVSTSAGRPSAASWPSDEAQIRALLTGSAEAYNRGDLKGHLSIYVDSVTYMTRNGPRPGVAAIERDFNAALFSGGMPKQQLRFEQVAVRRLDDGAALATGRFILSGGGLADQAGWFTLVWVRTADGWKSVHDHSS